MAGSRASSAATCSSAPASRRMSSGWGNAEWVIKEPRDTTRQASGNLLLLAGLLQRRLKPLQAPLVVKACRVYGTTEQRGSLVLSPCGLQAI